jgi:hypothetical protein
MAFVKSPQIYLVKNVKTPQICLGKNVNFPQILLIQYETTKKMKKNQKFFQERKKTSFGHYNFAA